MDKVPIKNINTESNHQNSEVNNKVIVLNQIDQFEECFVFGKRLHDVRSITLQPRDQEKQSKIWCNSCLRRGRLKGTIQFKEGGIL